MLVQPRFAKGIDQLGRFNFRLGPRLGMSDAASPRVKFTLTAWDEFTLHHLERLHERCVQASASLRVSLWESEHMSCEHCNQLIMICH